MELEFFIKNFANWTSGNEIIDNFIQEKQLKHERYSAVFEWIPYDKFIEIKGIGKTIATAIWKEGPLKYYKNDEEWIRSSSYKEVILRFLYDSENITDEFINKVNSYLLEYEENYGISQNPDTKDYVLVFSKESFESFCCKKCGDIYKYDYEDYKDYYYQDKDKEYKWCKSCHINHLKNNFTNWASGNEKIDNFIQQKQVNIKTSFDLIFEWIPFNEFIEIKEIGKGGFSVAIWKEGPLCYNIIEKEWMKKSYKNVVLKYLSNLQNITDELLNEATVLYDSYGISQNPNTKDYILVIRHEYYKKYCGKCDKEYIKPDHNWCESCQINYLKNNFINWSSGNENIDEFIQKMQLKISNESSNVFEWIPYNEFIDIKEIGYTTAIRKEGRLYFDTNKMRWMRTTYEKVCLKYLSQEDTDEFINKDESSLTNEICYGVSQNPITKDYILVFKNDYFVDYCEKCGSKYENTSCNNEYCENKHRWCKCRSEYLKNDFTNWTSGNGEFDSLIQKYQLKYNGHSTVFEWIPYDKFININKIGEGGLAIAIWKDGPLYYNYLNRKYKRKLNKKVLLKYLSNSQNINNKFLSEINYFIEEGYGISQDPNTKDYILILQLKYYCEKCGKKYDNEFEINNKSCILCQINHDDKKINDFIQEMRLNIDHNASNSIIFEWIPYDQFDDIKEIGKGGFSIVYSAIWKDGSLCHIAGDWERETNKKVALKCLHNSQNFLDEFINKVKAYPNQIIDNILKIYGISQNPDTKDYIMVLEYAEGGNFNNYLDKNYENFDWFNGLRVLRDVFNGLSKIHQKQMIHRDLHIGNILFTKIPYDSCYKPYFSDSIFYIEFLKRAGQKYEVRDSACVSDMELCRRIGDINETNIYGVIPYVAPEVLKGKPYTQAADIYSFGMIMYVIATGRQPFINCAHDEILILNIYNGIRPEVNEQLVPKCYIDLMKRCWDSNPNNRPNSIEINEMIELFYSSLDQEFKKEQQHYEVEKQFKETQEYRKENFLSLKNNKSAIHAQAVYTSRLLNPFTKKLS
ncbi:hypothetical protein RclHR1_04490008 [Rhizophagus clarus]|uniref:Protein kinase domain-containing protein n=1 Tax=Rhizophagus clarus TaxID=94130 RepID=A0A2Z6S074_9GLOM|nr:hypothetical protein RclHR1_04490008 [Rhizophagus clarus]